MYLGVDLASKKPAPYLSRLICLHLVAVYSSVKEKISYSIYAGFLGQSEVIHLKSGTITKVSNVFFADRIVLSDRLLGPSK